MRFAARILGFFLPFLFIFLFLKPSFAQTLTYPNNQAQYLNPNTETNVPKNFHNYTQSVFIELLSSLVCQLSGVDPVNPNQSCLGVNPKTNQIGYVQNSGGLIGFLSYGINSMYTPPLHTSDYFKYLGQNFGIAKSSYAQGVGFDALQPLIPIWSAFRNITYLLFVFIFILIGLGIMLRKRIDERAVMTIQNQIPKIVIALILIFFSYAIAGFLIDIMYVSIYLFYGVFANISPNIAALITPLSPAAIQGKNVLEAAGSLGLWNIANKVALSGKDTLNVIMGVTNFSPDNNPLGGLATFANLFTSLVGISNWNDVKILDMVYNIFGAISAIKLAAAIPCAGSAIPFLGGLSCVGQSAIEAIPIFLFIEVFLRDLLPYLLIYLVVLVAVLFTLFRVFFMLIKSYVLIIFAVIFAPFWIATGIIPGFSQGKGFGSWIRDIIANIAVFPAVYIMFLLAIILSDAFKGGINFSPPLLGNPLAPGFLGAIIGLGILLLTPDAAKMIRDAIKAPNLPIGGGGGLRAGVAVVGAPVGAVRSSLFGVNKQGQPQPISAWAGRKFGTLAQGLTGGGFQREKGDGSGGKSFVNLPGRLNERLGKAWRSQKQPPPQETATNLGPEKTHREPGTMTHQDTVKPLEDLKRKSGY